MTSNVVATSSSNEELNSTADECHELANYNVSRRSTVVKIKKFFIIFLTYPLFLLQS